MAPRCSPLLGPSRDEEIEAWPYLDEAVLLKTRSHKVCMTCHWLRHHAGANCIPVLTCRLHQALIAHSERLTHRCQGWTDAIERQLLSDASADRMPRVPHPSIYRSPE